MAKTAMKIKQQRKAKFSTKENTIVADTESAEFAGK